VTAFVTREETKAYLESVGARLFTAGPEELAAFQEADTKRWAKIVEIAKIEKK
jgi:tripartite-type tricarboxylate transporter receptor subunit TctC